MIMNLQVAIVVNKDENLRVDDVWSTSLASGSGVRTPGRDVVQFHQSCNDKDNNKEHGQYEWKCL